jgi:hypothetical protein
MLMTSIFHITGGLGKHVAATSVVNSFKKTFPDKRVVVSSAYPDVFDGNPNVYRSFDINKHQYFYDDYINGKEVEIFAQEPYKQTSHITKNYHLIDTWCDMIGISNTESSTIYPNFREKEIAKVVLNQYNNKPIIIFQPFGGLANNIPYCWARDIHPDLAQIIVNELSDKYNVIHICNPNHPKLENCVRLDERYGPGVLFSLLGLSNRRILIDSCLQHAAASMGLKSMVIWGVTSPQQFGYDIHNNITSNLSDEGHAGSYLFDYEINGIVGECPFSDWRDMFDVNLIMENIERIKNQ